MTRETKFTRGRAITDPHELLDALLVGCWFYWPSSPRPKHPQILLNMSAQVLINAARHGRLHIAIQREPGK